MGYRPGAIEGDVLKRPRYRDILEWVVQRHADGAAPSVAEVSKHFAQAPTTTHDQAKRLEEQELLTIDRVTPALVRLIPTDEGRQRVGFEPPLRVLRLDTSSDFAMQKFPIPCGPLRETNDEAEWVKTPFTDHRETDYLLEADGDSMIDPETGKGLRSGDMLHMRPGEWAENGQIVHAEYVRGDGMHDCTLKVYSLDEKTGEVTLWALNPKYPDITRRVGEIVVKGVLLDVTTPVGRARFTRK